MFRIITFFMLLIIGATTATAIAADNPPVQKGEVKDLQFNPGPSTQDHPRMPMYCPVSGYVCNTTISLFSNLAGEAEIIIMNDEGLTVFHSVADLSGGYAISIHPDMRCSVICIIIGGRKYSADL